jgi:hypothetical protein
MTIFVLFLVFWYFVGEKSISGLVWKSIVTLIGWWVLQFFLGN